jgi:hypothetical protein
VSAVGLGGDMSAWVVEVHIVAMYLPGEPRVPFVSMSCYSYYGHCVSGCCFSVLPASTVLCTSLTVVSADSTLYLETSHINSI